MAETVPVWSDRHPEKAALRQAVWANLKTHRVTHRDPVGHIPHVIGAEQAAARLATLPIWQTASVVKCNPDSPQAPVRLRALQDGKVLYMAVPRLTEPQCFVELEGDRLRAQGIALDHAATMTGALQVGRRVGFEEMAAIALVVVGCVAVSTQGSRLGKGAGFADLELAMLCEAELIQADTPIVTTVHPLQIVADDRLPTQPHDWPLDWIITASEARAICPTRSRPTGLDWAAIQPDQWQTIPILRSLAPEP
ncbi:MAG: 5-formyltetrahydrofolate cyclo-ligase [Leptolyngbyaceae cyanobacterium T60_A2020_046]|nr:5-formyltetrahydrofolate cyclo-ligase [Leptolyngbyaceae cyanobacterium T60_A2020_046]